MEVEADDLMVILASEARRIYRRHPGLRGMAMLDEEDFVQAAALHLWRKKVRVWLRELVHREMEREVAKWTRKKRLPGSIRGLTERDEADLGAGGKWDAADSLAAREALLRMLDPGSGSRLGWREARVAQNLLPEVP